MSIRNLWLTAGCVLWLLVLVFLAGKLAADRFRRRSRRREKKKITRFFSLECSPMEQKRLSRDLARYSRDHVLFSYICDCYSGLPAEQQGLNSHFSCMEYLFHGRITRLRKDDRLGRIQLARNISRCRVSSGPIDRFLEECKTDPAYRPTTAR